MLCTVLADRTQSPGKPGIINKCFGVSQKVAGSILFLCQYSSKVIISIFGFVSQCICLADKFPEYIMLDGNGTCVRIGNRIPVAINIIGK